MTQEKLIVTEYDSNNLPVCVDRSHQCNQCAILFSTKWSVGHDSQTEDN